MTTTIKSQIVAIHVWITCTPGISCWFLKANYENGIKHKIKVMNGAIYDIRLTSILDVIVDNSKMYRITVLLSLERWCRIISNIAIWNNKTRTTSESITIVPCSTMNLPKYNVIFIIAMIVNNMESIVVVKASCSNFQSLLFFYCCRTERN
jgi:hypothetical protein